MNNGRGSAFRKLVMATSPGNSVLFCVRDLAQHSAERGLFFTVLFELFVVNCVQKLIKSKKIVYVLF